MPEELIQAATKAEGLPAENMQKFHCAEVEF